MPEEAVIALVVLLAIGWLAAVVIGALLKCLAAAADSTSHGLSSFISSIRSSVLRRRRAALVAHVRILLPDELKRAELEIQALDTAFNARKMSAKWTPKAPSFKEVVFKPYLFRDQAPASRSIDISDIQRILKPNLPTWSATEEKLLSQPCAYPAKLAMPQIESFLELNVPTISLQSAAFEVDADTAQQRGLQKRITKCFGKELNEVTTYNHARKDLLFRYETLVNEITEWNVSQRHKWLEYKATCQVLAKKEELKYQTWSGQFEAACKQEKVTFSETIEGFRAKSRSAVQRRVEWILRSMELPLSLPRFWNIDYDESEQILIVEIALPDVVNSPPAKTVVQKNGPVSKPLNQTERRELVPKIQPAIMLRAAYEILRNDQSDTIKLLALNGWVEHIDPHTGRDTKTYTACLMVTAQQMSALTLENVEPLTAFNSLKGKSAGRLVEIIPIEPTLNLSKSDPRFVDGRIILDGLAPTTNLAAMDWQDFEHLIRELFEREFSANGAEVKITQASRDRGVDAIAFDPDPIKGGKFVIQAKRYTNVVDVSAVRDLCAVVRKEGASRGILVTTSTYGADAYEFANNEPVTLLNGAQLLGLLIKHGYNFRIDLAEARRANSSAF